MPISYRQSASNKKSAESNKFLQIFSVILYSKVLILKVLLCCFMKNTNTQQEKKLSEAVLSYLDVHDLET